MHRNRLGSQGGGTDYTAGKSPEGPRRETFELHCFTILWNALNIIIS